MSGRRTETLERDGQIYAMHVNQVPHPVIAEKFGVSTATVGHAVRRAIQDQFRLSADEERAVVSDQIDWLMRRLRIMMSHTNYVVSVSGKVALNPMTGEPLVDEGPVRAAMEQLRKLLADKRKLLGLDMPVRHRVEITDKMDDEIERLATELAMHGAGSEVQPEAPLAVGGGDGDDNGSADAPF
jgi:hypothetical protein